MKRDWLLYLSVIGHPKHPRFSDLLPSVWKSGYTRLLVEQKNLPIPIFTKPGVFIFTETQPPNAAPINHIELLSVSACWNPAVSWSWLSLGQVKLRWEENAKQMSSWLCCFVRCIVLIPISISLAAHTMTLLKPGEPAYKTRLSDHSEVIKNPSTLIKEWRIMLPCASIVPFTKGFHLIAKGGYSSLDCANLHIFPHFYKSPVICICSLFVLIQCNQIIH